MTPPGRIAIVVTCRDLGGMLMEALESVERQTRPAAEIIVVDDASVDIATRQVLARIAQHGTCVVQAGGRGASAARNIGARLTTAEYLVWLDADDVLEPGYFEAAAARLDADADLDFVSCAMRAFGAADYVWSPSRPTFVDAVATGGVPHASTMMRRRLWQSVGGFDETLPSFELLDFWASALERGCRGVVLEEPLLRYRVRAGSAYRRSIQPATYRARLQHFYAKHRPAVEHHGLALIEAKEAFLLDQRAYRQSLETRAASLEAELAQLQGEIGDTVRELESRGLTRVALGDLRRVEPISPVWGRDRGTAIDRHYIERFLDAHRSDVRGRVLEVRDSTYTDRFGSEVTSRDVLDVDAANDRATIVADLRCASAIPSSTYDCIVLAQTLHLIDDMRAVVAECARILRPGGVLLATAPSVIRVDDEAGVGGDYWRLTEASARTLFAGVFPLDAFEVTAYGNVMTCSAFLYGLSVEEMTRPDLDHADPRFPLVIAIRAVKPAPVGRTLSGPPEAGPEKVRPTYVPGTNNRAVILAYHRVADFAPDSHALCTPPDEFRAQMAYLRDHFSPIGLEELVRAAASGSIPERAVAVTLDDGYVDHLTVASPILAALGVPATFFVNTDRVEDEHERWWDILEQILLSGMAVPAALDIEIGAEHVRASTRSIADRAQALELLNRTAWPLDAEARQDLVANVVRWCGETNRTRSSHRVLTAAEIRTLAERPGHAIGAHTVNHLALTRHSIDTKRGEIVNDKLTLERLLRRPVHLFSYPYGDFDPETIAVVRDAGFRAAVTVEPGLVSAGTNRLLLPRYEVTRAERGRFAERMSEIFEQPPAAAMSTSFDLVSKMP